MDEYVLDGLVALAGGVPTDVWLSLRRVVLFCGLVLILAAFVLVVAALVV